MMARLIRERIGENTRTELRGADAKKVTKKKGLKGSLLMQSS
jgi:hypothetical protein